MATPLGWSQGGSGSVCLAFDQLRDVIESQEELIQQLRNVRLRQRHAECSKHSPRPSLSQALLQMVLQDENFVSKEEFQAVEKKLVEEKAAHAKTKALLAKEEEKLQFALGEVEVLSKQLEKEKLAFEKALPVSLPTVYLLHSGSPVSRAEPCRKPVRRTSLSPSAMELPP
ncbi:spermatogenesis-associated protein 24 isoform X6 [Canis lupus baileyi]|uniref:spermatogenesis-associated protein 24 isoform X7 n=1 Tax=Canis lupus dingo TaxID=286419 RepID=UPI0015F15046|nr:spermatogenesis-associated protein 24 isoform X7 [Canis lupus dingo]XP_038313677.1 spermatogenesis-associated protein 24 isoform X6 [Canis lupus familiaris]XP_038386194.1 spermatogenesis-associated protein 24 isoform X6 [Canis lupus familiaris]XP_038514486.1 spermatogenesis-associated protein 24 isoform X6 [Canis lupus familiaris]